MHTSRINHISVDRAERLALTCSQDRTARLWELPTGRLLRVLRPPIGRGKEGELDGCSLSPDGMLAAVGGWTGAEWDRSDSVYIFDTATGRMAHRLTGSTDVIQDLSFPPMAATSPQCIWMGRACASGIRRSGAKWAGRAISPAGQLWRGLERRRAARGRHATMVRCVFMRSGTNQLTL